MPYEIVATKNTPGYIVFAIDISGSMATPMKDGIARIDAVNQALQAALTSLVQRSTKGNIISPRYRVAIIAYSDSVFDVLGGFQPIDHIASMGIPTLTPQQRTNTAACFMFIKNLLLKELDNIPENVRNSIPAPLVIHVTDGGLFEVNEDFEPIVKEIQAISLPDGNVLVENIYISDEIDSAKSSPELWAGFKPGDSTNNQYLNKLLNCSSTMPETYRLALKDQGISSLRRGALMFFPGLSTEFITMGVRNLRMSSMTKIDTNKPDDYNEDENGSIWDGWILSGTISVEKDKLKEREKGSNDDRAHDRSTEFKTTLAYPRLFSKRYSSTVLVYIYPKSMSRKINTALDKQIQTLGKSINDYNRSDSPIDIKRELLAIVKIESPGIEFQSPVVVRIREKETKIVFIAKPADDCQIGKHMAKLSICDKETEAEIFSVPFEIKVVDFVIDHISRPFVYNIVAAFSGLGALAMFILTFLGKVDTTFGLASGTTAGAVAITLYLRFVNLFQSLRNAPGSP